MSYFTVVTIPAVHNETIGVFNLEMSLSPHDGAEQCFVLFVGIIGFQAPDRVISPNCNRRIRGDSFCLSFAEFKRWIHMLPQQLLCIFKLVLTLCFECSHFLTLFASNVAVPIYHAIMYN